MSRYPNKLFLSALLFTNIAGGIVPVNAADNDPVSASLVKEKNITDSLIRAAAKVNVPADDIEAKQIVEVKQSGGFKRYVVPVKVNSGENRGCYVLTFDDKLQPKQKLLLSTLDELETCELVAAVFSCNREKEPRSGIGVLYGKRLGATSYWFEGTFLTTNHAGLLNENRELSAKLADVERASVAKKKLACN